MTTHSTTPAPVSDAVTAPPQRGGLTPPGPATVAPPAQAPFIAKLLIIVFVAAYLVGALWLLLDVWVLELVNLRRLLGVPADAKLPPVFLSALHALLGAVLGAGVLDIVNFHRYVSVKGDFQARHVWGYFVAPLLAAVLGLVVFALLQSGLLVFAGGAKDDGGDLARLGYLAVGFLAGFGWFEATESIRGIVKRFFSAGTDRRPPPAAPGAGAPAEPAAPAAATPGAPPPPDAPAVPAAPPPP